MLERWGQSAVVAVTFLWLMCSCAHQDISSNGPTLQSGPELALPLDPYLSEDQIARNANYAYTEIRQGNLHFLRNLESSPQLSNMQLQPGADGMAWVIYRFGPLVPGQQLSQVGVTLSPGSDSAGIYIAISNYARASWEYLTPTITPGQATADLSTAADYSSPSGFIYVAVLTFGSETVVIDRLELQKDEAVPPPPVNITATSGTENSGILLTWQDPAITYDPDGAGPQTFRYHSVTISASNGGFARLPAGTTSYLFENCSPAEAVSFELRTAVNELDYGGRPSAPVSGVRGALPVPGLEFEYADNSGEQAVTLDASNSFDPDGGTIVEYAWDLHDDGTVDYISTQPTWLINLDTSQFTAVMLWVTDNEGNVAETGGTVGPPFD